MNHKLKKKLAKKFGGFNSVAWQNRKDAIALGVKNKIEKIKKVIKLKRQNDSQN